MSKIGKIRELIRNGLYYLTEHADQEAADEGFDIKLLVGKFESLQFTKTVREKGRRK